MAKLPGYQSTKVASAITPGAAPVSTADARALGQFTQGIGNLAQVRSQMMDREARDYTINAQNKTTVALASEKVRLQNEATTGSEYTEGIKAFIDTQKQAALEGTTNQRAADSVGKYYDALAAEQMSQAVSVSAKMNAVNTVEVVKESLEIGMNQTYRDPSSYEESLANATLVISTSDIPESAKEKAIQEQTESLMTQKLLGIINQDPKAAVKEIESGDYDSLSPDTLNKLSASAKSQSDAVDRQNEINRTKVEVENQKQLNAQNAQAQSNLEIGVSRGEMGFVEIEKAYDTGVITPEKRTQLTKSVDARVKKMQDENIIVAQVSAAIDAGQPLDYRNPDHKKGVDAFYKNLPDESKTPDVIVSLVNSTKVIPSQVETMLNASMKGSPDQVESASNLVARLNESSPEASSQLPEDTRAMGIGVANMVAGGVSPAKAVEVMHNNIYNTSKEMKEVLKSQLTQKDLVSKKASGFKAALGKVSDSFFTPKRTPSMNSMEAEFNLIANNYYMKTQDIDSAIKLATADIQKVWGSTWVDGKERVMKYSPEKIYGNGGETPWIYNQLESELKDMGIDGKYNLQSDAVTARSERPSYLIMTEQNGVMMPLMVDGVLQRYTPDFSVTKEAKEAEEEKIKAVERARGARDYIDTGFRYKTKYGVSR